MQLDAKVNGERYPVLSFDSGHSRTKTLAMIEHSITSPKLRILIRGEEIILADASDVVNDRQPLPNTPSPHHIRDYAILAHNIYYANDTESLSIKDWTKLEIGSELLKSSLRPTVKGLELNVLYKKQSNKENLAVLVFRGTNSLLDWIPNLRWFFKLSRRRVYRDHFEQVSDRIDAIIAGVLRHLGPSTTIEATGHSLGGGLAQHAAYASGKIKTIYTFNTSPVTGYRSVDRKVRLQNCKGIVTFRIYQSGEVLSYLNRSMQLAKSPFNCCRGPNENPRIVEAELRCDFVGDPIKRHSMRMLALNLDRLHAQPFIEVDTTN